MILKLEIWKVRRILAEDTKKLRKLSIQHSRCINNTRIYGPRVYKLEDMLRELEGKEIKWIMLEKLEKPEEE